MYNYFSWLLHLVYNYNFGKVVCGFADFFVFMSCVNFYLWGGDLCDPVGVGVRGGCACPQVARHGARPRCGYYFVRPLWGLFFTLGLGGCTSRASLLCVNLGGQRTRHAVSLHCQFGGWTEARVELFLSSYSSRFRCSRCFAIQIRQILRLGGCTS